MKATILTITACAVLALALSGCGEDKTSTTAGSETAATQSTSMSAVKISAKDSDLGTVLAGADGKTIYLFEADKDGKSACSGDCAAAWPPVTGEATAGDGAESDKLGTIKRDDGSSQVTYAGHPLYYYVKDTDEEDTYGQEVDSFGAEWYAVTTSGAKASGDGASKSEDSSSGSKSYGY